MSDTMPAGDDQGVKTLLVIICAGVASLILAMSLLVAILGTAAQQAAANDCAGGTVQTLTGVNGEGVVTIAHANLYSRLSGAAFAEDLQRVISGRPDFVTLNETPRRTDRQLTPPGYASWRANSPGEAREAPVLWRTDAWKLVDQGTVLMHRRAVKWGTRYVNWATLEATGAGNVTAGQLVSVISGHASPGGRGRDGLLREFVSNLTSLIGQLATRGPVLVGADLNTHYPRSQFLAQWLTASNTVSTFDALGEPKGGWVTGEVAGIIDYILVTGATPLTHATRALAHSNHKLVTASVAVGSGTLPGAAGQGGRDRAQPAAPAASTSDPGALPVVDGWTPEQVGNAAAIIAAGVELGVSARGQRIAVMTAIGESSLRVLDYGDAAGPDSRGLFQQRANGAWGSLADRMDPRISSLNFYKALLRVPGWERLVPTIAAHRTQNNADPYHYEPYWEPAGVLTAALTGAVAASGSGVGECVPVAAVSAGEITWPLDPALAQSSDNHNWGGSGGSWSSWHTGTDFSVSCGTPVYAVHAGTIEIDTTQAWSGRWLVKVSTGPGQLTTWYAHMQAVSVTNGQVVTSGQQIGEVGDLGNSTGCHLHFEVHTAGGSIYGADNVNPSDWLASNVGTIAPAA